MKCNILLRPSYLQDSELPSEVHDAARLAGDADIDNNSEGNSASSFHHSYDNVFAEVVQPQQNAVEQQPRLPRPFLPPHQQPSSTAAAAETSTAAMAMAPQTVRQARSLHRNVRASICLLRTRHHDVTPLARATRATAPTSAGVDRDERSDDDGRHVRRAPAGPSVSGDSAASSGSAGGRLRPADLVDLPPARQCLAARKGSMVSAVTFQSDGSDDDENENENKDGLMSGEGGGDNTEASEKKKGDDNDDYDASLDFREMSLTHQSEEEPESTSPREAKERDRCNVISPSPIATDGGEEEESVSLSGSVDFSTVTGRTGRTSGGQSGLSKSMEPRASRCPPLLTDGGGSELGGGDSSLRLRHSMPPGMRRVSFLGHLNQHLEVTGDVFDDRLERCVARAVGNAGHLLDGGGPGGLAFERFALLSVRTGALLADPPTFSFYSTATAEHGDGEGDGEVEVEDDRLIHEGSRYLDSFFLDAADTDALALDEFPKKAGGGGSGSLAGPSRGNGGEDSDDDNDDELDPVALSTFCFPDGLQVRVIPRAAMDGAKRMGWVGKDADQSHLLVFTDGVGETRHGIAITVRSEIIGSRREREGIASSLNARRNMRAASTRISRWYRRLVREKEERRENKHEKWSSGGGSGNSVPRLLRSILDGDHERSTSRMTLQSVLSDRKPEWGSTSRNELPVLRRVSSDPDILKDRAAAANGAEFDSFGWESGRRRRRRSYGSDPGGGDGVDDGNNGPERQPLSPWAIEKGREAYECMLRADALGDAVIAEKCYVMIGGRADDQALLLSCLQQLKNYECEENLLSSFGSETFLSRKSASDESSLDDGEKAHQSYRAKQVDRRHQMLRFMQVECRLTEYQSKVSYPKCEVEHVTRERRREYFELALPLQSITPIKLPLPLPSVDKEWGFAKLLSTIGSDSTLLALRLLLLERSILVLGNRADEVTASCRALLELLKPFHWASTFMPVLPFCMLDFVGSPVPFIAGMAIENSEGLDLIMDDPSVVDAQASGMSIIHLTKSTFSITSEQIAAEKLVLNANLRREILSLNQRLSVLLNNKESALHSFRRFCKSGPSPEEAIMLQSARNQIRDYFSFLYGETSSGKGWFDRYGLLDTEGNHFNPSSMLDALRAELNFQEEFLRTQLFSGFVEASRVRSEEMEATRRDEEAKRLDALLNPASYPRTAQGLTAFLAAVDADRPLEQFGQEAAAATALSRTSAEQLNPAVTTHQESNFAIRTGKRREVPIAIKVARSTVKIEKVTLIEGASVEFGMELRGNQDNNKLMQSTRITATAGIDSSSCDDDEFRIDTAPSVVVLTFGNDSAWFRSSIISYCVTVTKPTEPIVVQTDGALLERAERAERAIELLRAEMGPAEEEAARAARELEAVEKEACVALSAVDGGDDTELQKQREELALVEKEMWKAEEAANVKAVEVGLAQDLADDAERAVEAIYTNINNLMRQVKQLQAKRQILSKEKEARNERLERSSSEHRDSLATVKRLTEELEERQKLVDEAADWQRKEKERVGSISKRHEAAKLAEKRASNRMSFMNKQYESLKLRLLDSSKESDFMTPPSAGGKLPSSMLLLRDGSLLSVVQFLQPHEAENLVLLTSKALSTLMATKGSDPWAALSTYYRSLPISFPLISQLVKAGLYSSKESIPGQLLRRLLFPQKKMVRTSVCDTEAESPPPVVTPLKCRSMAMIVQVIAQFETGSKPLFCQIIKKDLEDFFSNDSEDPIHHHDDPVVYTFSKKDAGVDERKSNRWNTYEEQYLRLNRSFELGLNKATAIVHLIRNSSDSLDSVCIMRGGKMSCRFKSDIDLLAPVCVGCECVSEGSIALGSRKLCTVTSHDAKNSISLSKGAGQTLNVNLRISCCITEGDATSNTLNVKFTGFRIHAKRTHEVESGDCQDKEDFFLTADELDWEPIPGVEPFFGYEKSETNMPNLHMGRNEAPREANTSEPRQHVLQRIRSAFHVRDDGYSLR